MAERLDRPPKNPHTAEQLEIMRCRHVYQVARAKWERLKTQAPTRPGMRPNLPVTCVVCGVVRLLYAGEPLQPGERVELLDAPEAEEAGQIVDEPAADEIELPARGRRAERR